MAEVHTEAIATEQLPTLFQFRLSHFNEKARWALDYKGIPHRRRSLLPGTHVPTMLWVSRQQKVPVLILDGAPIIGSAAIIDTLERRYPAPPLYPESSSERQRALELAKYFDEELGPHIRRAFFHEILPDTAYCAALFTDGYSAPARMAYHFCFPAVRALMRYDMDIDDETARASRESTVVVLSRLEQLVGESPYLVGDRFSVADLTAAALLSPVAQPLQFAYPYPPATEAIEHFRRSLGHRRIFDWCRAVYEKHRGVSAEHG